MIFSGIVIQPFKVGSPDAFVGVISKVGDGYATITCWHILGIPLLIKHMKYVSFQLMTIFTSEEAG